MPTQVSMQLTEAQIRQIEALTAAGFGNRSDVVRIAVDRMYREETRTMQLLIHRDPAGTEVVGRIVGNCDTVSEAVALLGIGDDQLEGDSPRYDYNLLALVDETDLAAEFQTLDE